MACPAGLRLDRQRPAGWSGMTRSATMSGLAANHMSWHLGQVSRRFRSQGRSHVDSALHLEPVQAPARSVPQPCSRTAAGIGRAGRRGTAEAGA
jgi:hypothetical protein